MTDKSKDYLNQLSEYIIKNISKGYTVEALRFSLINQGYSRLSVDNAIKTANEKLAAQAPIIKEKPQIIHRLITPDNTYTYEKNNGFFKKFFRKIFGK